MEKSDFKMENSEIDLLVSLISKILDQTYKTYKLSSNSNRKNCISGI